MYKRGTETVRCFAAATSLMRELRHEASSEGGSSDLARKVWKLGKVEGTMDRSASVG